MDKSIKPYLIYLTTTDIEMVLFYLTIFADLKEQQFTFNREITKREKEIIKAFHHLLTKIKHLPSVEYKKMKSDINKEEQLIKHDIAIDLIGEYLVESPERSLTKATLYDLVQWSAGKYEI